MGDSTAATITIYGRIETLAQFEQISQAVIGQYVRDVDNILIDTPAALAAALLTALDAPDEGLFLQDEEASYGTFRHIEAVCRRYALPFVADWEAAQGFGPGRRSWHPDFEDEIEASTVDGAVAVSIGEVRMAMDAPDPMAALTELIALADKINGVGFPPIAVSEAVLAHIRSLR